MRLTVATAMPLIFAAFSLTAGRMNGRAAILVFRVEDVVFVRAGGEPRRVLSLRRLDQLNMSHSLLGMQTEELSFEEARQVAKDRPMPVVAG